MLDFSHEKPVNSCRERPCFIFSSHPSLQCMVETDMQGKKFTNMERNEHSSNGTGGQGMLKQSKGLRSQCEEDKSNVNLKKVMR